MYSYLDKYLPKNDYQFQEPPKTLPLPVIPKPIILQQIDAMRPENLVNPFANSVTIAKNYKNGGVAPLEPINPVPRNPNVDTRQFEAAADAKFNF